MRLWGEICSSTGPGDARDLRAGGPQCEGQLNPDAVRHYLGRTTTGPIAVVSCAPQAASRSRGEAVARPDTLHPRVDRPPIGVSRRASPTSDPWPLYGVGWFFWDPHTKSVQPTRVSARERLQALRGPPGVRRVYKGALRGSAGWLYFYFTTVRHPAPEPAPYKARVLARHVLPRAHGPLLSRPPTVGARSRCSLELPFGPLVVALRLGRPGHPLSRRCPATLGGLMTRPAQAWTASDGVLWVAGRWPNLPLGVRG